MKKRIKIKNVLAFLLQKGWKLLYDTHKFHVLEGPAHFKFDPDPYFSIPLEKYEEVSGDYDYFMDRFANLVSDLYDINKVELVKLWTQTPEEIKAEIKEKEDFLTYVS